MTEIKVYIEARGSCVWGVYADAPKNIEIIPVLMDYDELECEGGRKVFEELQKNEAETLGLENLLG